MASVLHDYQYSVQVKSRFDLLLNDDFNSEDPDLLMQKIQTRQKRESKSSKSSTKPKTTEEGTHARKTSDSAESIPKEKHEDLTHKEEKSSQNLVESRKNEASFNTTVEDYREDEIQPLNQRNESWEPRGRGVRGRSGFTRSRMVRSQGQREFDRHSGSDKSGVKPLIKKDGYGTGNWGTIEDELDVTMPANGELLEQPFEDNDEEMVDGKQASPDAPVEEQKTLTLKEYKELKKATKPSVQLTTKSSRQANDGKDVFSNMIAHNKPKPTKQIIEVANDEKAVEEPKPAFFEISRSKPQRGRGTSSIQRDQVKQTKTPEKIVQKVQEVQEAVSSETQVDGLLQDGEKGVIHTVGRGGQKNVNRGATRNFARGNSRNIERGSSRNFDRTSHREIDPNIPQNDSRNIYRGTPRNIERGGPRTFERRPSRGFDRGAPRSFDRGARRNFDRGGPRTFVRGISRNFERRVSHNLDRDDVKEPEPISVVHTDDQDNGDHVSRANTNDQGIRVDLQTEVPYRGSFRGRGNFGRGRGAPGRAPFRPRGRFRGSFDHLTAEGSSRKVVQPPSMDSDFDFPSLN